MRSFEIKFNCMPWHFNLAMKSSNGEIPAHLYGLCGMYHFLNKTCHYTASSMGAVTVQCHQPYEVKAGSSFAELEMLNHEPNRFSVVAKGRCHLFLVTQRDIHHVLKSHPHYRMAIEQYIITSRQPQYDFGKL